MSDAYGRDTEAHQPQSEGSFTRSIQMLTRDGTSTNYRFSNFSAQYWDP